MKMLNKLSIALLAFCLALLCITSSAQAVEKNDLNITVNYFLTNNKVPYLMVKVTTKINGKFTNVSGIGLKLFLDKDSTGTFIGKAFSNEKGEAFANIPPSVKSEWATSQKHTFLAVFDGDKKYEASKAELTISKAKVLIEAGSDKTVTATVFELKDTAWVPAKGVEVVLAVKRMGADLTINETPTFTTDSTGKVSGDFKRDSIPGDAKGNIVLVAKITDNDQYGNLRVEKVVNWGAKFVAVSDFDKRTLFATRTKAPVWLMLVATSIIIAVWGILIFLVVNILKIKKMGNNTL